MAAATMPNIINGKPEFHYEAPTLPRCLKITEKVSFNIVSEASYVYILSGQKLTKNAKNGPFWRVFEIHLFGDF